MSSNRMSSACLSERTSIILRASSSACRCPPCIGTAPDEHPAPPRAAADGLGIRHYVLNLERQFAERVVDTFVREYARGRTPNPCLACNDRVKFRPLLEHALALDAGYLATGHYVRLRKNGNGFEIWRAADPAKDQSYVLYTLGQRELSRTLFPLGDLPKAEVRAIARRHGLPNADKPDSADICFIPSGDYRSFVAERLESTVGEIVDTAGNRGGEHAGIANYTVGQRRGLAAGGGARRRARPARGGGEPLFVVGVDAEQNAVVVGPHAELMSPGLIAEELSFVSGETPEGPFRAAARIRYRSEPAPATVTVSGGTAEVRFDTPQRAVTPGQAVGFYDGELLLGGGTRGRLTGGLDAIHQRPAAGVGCRVRRRAATGAGEARAARGLAGRRGARRRRRVRGEPRLAGRAAPDDAGAAGAAPRGVGGGARGRAGGGGGDARPLPAHGAEAQAVGGGQERPTGPPCGQIAGKVDLRCIIQSATQLAG